MKPPRPGIRPAGPKAVRHGLARVLSKAGYCSRSQAERLIREGRVQVDGRRVLDPEFATQLETQAVTVDGERLAASQRCYIALNKPRGYVTTAADERGRPTVYQLLENAGLPWLGPVGRLDMASEGLLLLSNDSAWAARLTSPDSHVSKCYHVQINAVPDAAMLAQLAAGVDDGGEWLSARSVSLLRAGEKNAWLEIVLDEGRNRHLRRLLDAHGLTVQRLVRVSIGELPLGQLGKGQWRHLSAAEVDALAGSGQGA